MKPIIKVLLLEDEPSLQRAIARMLCVAFNDSDIALDTTDSAIKAIALLQCFQYDLILSDFDVLDGTGGDVLAWVRSSQPRMISRFVFFTGSDRAAALHDKIIAKGTPISELCRDRSPR